MPQLPDTNAYRTVKAEESVRLARLAHQQHQLLSSADVRAPRLSQVVRTPTPRRPAKSFAGSRVASALEAIGALVLPGSVASRSHR